MADWIVRIGDTEHRASSLDELRQWRREGRITDTTYIYHPVLERWLYPREVEELREPTSAPAAAPVAPPATVPSRNLSCTSGCVIVFAILVLVAMIGSGIQSCNNSRSAAERAANVLRGREKSAVDAKERRVQAIQRLKEGPSTSASETARACIDIGSMSDVVAEVKQRCAQAYVAVARQAVTTRDFTTAAKYAALADGAGAASIDLAPIRSAIEKDEAIRRAAADAQRKKDEARRQRALQQMTKKYDKLEKVTWYRDRTSPQHTDVNAFFIYFGEQDRTVWLRWRLQYHSDSWLFINAFTVYVDGVPYEYENVSFERDNDTDIWEWYDTSPTSNDLSMIRSVIGSKEAVVRFFGQQYRSDRTISPEQKRALQRVLDAYEAKGGR